jgi:hypothetical protein
MARCLLGSLPGDVIGRIQTLIAAQPCDFVLHERVDSACSLRFQSYPSGACMSELPHGQQLDEFDVATLASLPVGCHSRNRTGGRLLRDFFIKQMTKLSQVLRNRRLGRRSILLVTDGTWEDAVEIDYGPSEGNYKILCTKGGSTGARMRHYRGCAVQITRGFEAWVVVGEQNLQERVYYRAQGNEHYDPLLIEEPDSEAQDAECAQVASNRCRSHIAAIEERRVECTEKLHQLEVLCQDMMLQGAVKGRIFSELSKEPTLASWAFLKHRMTTRLSTTSRHFTGAA